MEMQGGGEQRDVLPGGGADRADKAALRPDMGGDAGEMEGVRAFRREHCRSLTHALPTYTAPILHSPTTMPSIRADQIRSDHKLRFYFYHKNYLAAHKINTPELRRIQS